MLPVNVLERRSMQTITCINQKTKTLKRNKILKLWVEMNHSSGDADLRLWVNWFSPLAVGMNEVRISFWCNSLRRRVKFTVYAVFH